MVNGLSAGRSFVTAMAILTNGSEIVPLAEARVETYTPGEEKSDNITANVSVGVSSGGRYYVQLIVTSAVDDNSASFSGGVSAGAVMSYDYAKQVNESQFGRGIAIIFGPKEYLYYGNNTRKVNGADVTRRELVYKGPCDMPGVLAKARVGSDGFIYKKWGTYGITKVENISVGGANKRVYHNVGSDKYTAMCTAYGGGSTPVVYNETAAYVDVYATGSFNIMLIGDN